MIAARAAGLMDRHLESRLKWLLSGRLAIVLVCLFGAALFEPFRVNDASYATLLVAAVLNLVYLLGVRVHRGSRFLSVFPLATDVLLIGVLVYFTGIDRFFALLYFAAVIAGAAMLGPRGAVAMASGASIALATVSTLYFLAGNSDVALQLPWVEPERIQGHVTRLSFLLPYLFFFALSLHVVALLAARLAEEVRRVRILTDEILQNMAGSVIAADRFGVVQFVNAQMARLLGLNLPETLVGKQIDDALPGEIAGLLRQALQERERVVREVAVGKTPVALAASCLGDGHGGPPRGVVAVLNDLSLRVRMEEATRRADRFKALLEMSAGMAHEIRNPLASIRGAAQELGTGAKLSRDDRQLLQVVIRESDRLNRIIGDFLDYANDRPLEMSLFDLADILRETAVLLEARAEGARVQVVREITPRTVCRGAPDKLRQVFLNLALNALDACGGTGRVTIRCLPATGFPGDPRDGVLAEVEDDGRGIPPEDISRVFDPFFTTKPQGVGMGLAIARRIVQAHGGDIVLESRGGKGTVARVWLPT